MSYENRYPGRYDAYLYERLAKVERNEFGIYISYGSMLHKAPDSDAFVFAYNGERIVEIHPDDTCFLIVAKGGITNDLARRWSRLSPNTEFLFERTRRATGLNQYLLKRFKLLPNERNRHVHTGHITFNTRVRYGLDGSLSIDGLPQTEALQDRAKYRIFNKQLKSLRAVLYAQIKMHVHTSTDTDDWKFRSEMQRAISEILKVEYDCDHSYEDSNAFILVNTWMQEQDPLVAKHIAMLAFARCHSVARGEERLLRQVANILRRAQSYYLKNHCVTLHESLHGLHHSDQDREL